MGNPLSGFVARMDGRPLDYKGTDDGDDGNKKPTGMKRGGSAKGVPMKTPMSKPKVAPKAALAAMLAANAGGGGGGGGPPPGPPMGGPPPGPPPGGPPMPGMAKGGSVKKGPTPHKMRGKAEGTPTGKSMGAMNMGLKKGGVAKMSGDKMSGMSGAAKKAGSAGKAVMGSSGKGTKTMNIPASGKGKMSAGFAKGGSCKMARGGGIETRGKTRGKFV